MPRPDPPFPDGVFDAINAGLIVLDSERRISRWNQWMTAAARMPFDTVAGRRLEEVFPGPINPRLADAVTDALTSGVSSVLSHSLHATLLPLKTGDGRDMIHNVAVRQVAREPALCLVQVTDVTVATDRERWWVGRTFQPITSKTSLL